MSWTVNKLLQSKEIHGFYNHLKAFSCGDLGLIVYSERLNPDQRVSFCANGAPFPLFFFGTEKYQNRFIVDFSASNKIDHVLFPALTKKIDLISRPWIMDSWIAQPAWRQRGVGPKTLWRTIEKFHVFCVWNAFLLKALSSKISFGCCWTQSSL